MNFVFPNGQEARYVRRNDNYAIVYLSSHGGCDQACRFCHLTQTKQVEMEPATPADFFLQALKVLTHYHDQVQSGKEPPVQRIHFNWMARGEPLLNPHLAEHWANISGHLRDMASQLGVHDVRFKISTIMPQYRVNMDHFGDVPAVFRPTFYYSAYSYSPEWRRRWLPKALPLERGLTALQEWQKEWGGNVVLHWPFIKGENDSEQGVEMILSLVSAVRLKTRFNLVRYNPYSPVQGEESPEDVLQARFQQIAAKWPGSKIVSRVGFDVKASCGMFIQLKEAKP